MIDEQIRLKNQRKYSVSNIIAALAIVVAAFTSFFAYKQIHDADQRSVQTEEMASIKDVIDVATSFCNVYASPKTLVLWDYITNDFMPGVRNEPKSLDKTVDALFEMLNSAVLVLNRAYLYQEQSEKLRYLLFGVYSRDDVMNNFGFFLMDSNYKLKAAFHDEEAKIEESYKKNNAVDTFDALAVVFRLIRQ